MLTDEQKKTFKDAANGTLKSRSFEKASDLTKEYAASDNAEAKKIPYLLAELFVLFETGDLPNEL